MVTNKRRSSNSNKKESRLTILEAITTPLGFFVLALLIAETFLGVVLVGASLERADKIVGMWLGVGMFFLVVSIVAVLDWFKPSNLTFDRDAHLLDRGITPWGTDHERVNSAAALDGKKGEEL